MTTHEWHTLCRSWGIPPLLYNCRCITSLLHGSWSFSCQDLCDIEEELETKLGVFHVKILGLAGLGHGGSRGGGGGVQGKEGGSTSSGGLGGDSFEVQLKLCSQKWKARCRVSRGQQIWQDEDVRHILPPSLLLSLLCRCCLFCQIIFLGKVNDELYVKVLGIRRIHGNTLVGSVKCQTRQLFSFYPQVHVHVRIYTYMQNLYSKNAKGRTKRPSTCTCAHTTPSQIMSYV